MSTVENSINENNLQGFDYDFSKIFLGNTRTDTATFKNNTGGTLAFAAGTLLGRDSSDDTIVALDSTITTNGSNAPVGILMSPVASIADAATVTGVTFVTAGDLAEEQLVLIGNSEADLLTTVIVAENNRTILDLMKSQGLFPKTVDNLTEFDNSI